MPSELELKLHRGLEKASEILKNHQDALHRTYRPYSSGGSKLALRLQRDLRLQTASILMRPGLSKLEYDYRPTSTSTQAPGHACYRFERKTTNYMHATTDYTMEETIWTPSPRNLGELIFTTREGSHYGQHVGKLNGKDEETELQVFTTSRVVFPSGCGYPSQDVLREAHLESLSAHGRWCCIDRLGKYGEAGEELGAFWKHRKPLPPDGTACWDPAEPSRLEREIEKALLGKALEMVTSYSIKQSENTIVEIKILHSFIAYRFSFGEQFTDKGSAVITMSWIPWNTVTNSECETTVFKWPESEEYYQAHQVVWGGQLTKSHKIIKLGRINYGEAEIPPAVFASENRFTARDRDFMVRTTLIWSMQYQGERVCVQPGYKPIGGTGTHLPPMRIGGNFYGREMRAGKEKGEQVDASDFPRVEKKKKPQQKIPDPAERADVRSVHCADGPSLDHLANWSPYAASDLLSPHCPPPAYTPSIRP